MADGELTDWIGDLLTEPEEKLEHFDSLEPELSQGPPEVTLSGAIDILLQAYGSDGIDDGEKIHYLEIERDGDGWNEPFHERYLCVCGGWEVSWTQYDPEQTGRPVGDDVVIAWARHCYPKEA